MFIGKKDLSNMISRALGLLPVLACLAAPSLARAADCTVDQDCPKNQLCHASRCTKLTKNESLLAVSLSEFVPNAVLFIDDVPMGNVPWEGIVSVGEHRLRIEAPDYQSVYFTGKARSRTRETIGVTLVPIPTPPSEAPAPPPEEEEDEADQEHEGPGKFYVALIGQGGWGTAMWGDTRKRPDWSFMGGAGAGGFVVEDPVLFELGLSFAYGLRRVMDWPDYGDEDQRELHLGLIPRVLFPVVGKLFYLGFEVEAGWARAYRHYFYADLRGVMAIVPHRMFEIRLNPLGLEWVQDAGGKGAFINYNASAGIAVRFG
jgi:hypothetical protein